MENPRIYGLPPYKTAVVHGGPGAPGGMADVASRLSAYTGILEPLQTGRTIDEEIDELQWLITATGTPPCILIGHSWGAWLTLLTAARYPDLVSKIILVASAPFLQRYAISINNTRTGRLGISEQRDFNAIMQQMSVPGETGDKTLSQRLHRIMLKSDCFELSSGAELYGSHVTIDTGIFNSIWQEAAELRNSGALIKAASSLRCPVVAIHGDYDPHPADGVEKPLAAAVGNFRFILLDKCGHYPWLEKHAAEKFYDILRSEIL